MDTSIGTDSSLILYKEGGRRGLLFSGGRRRGSKRVGQYYGDNKV
jgi:hypothetical protein